MWVFVGHNAHSLAAVRLLDDAGECETTAMSNGYNSNDPRSEESFNTFKGPYEGFQSLSVTLITDHCIKHGISSYDIINGVGGLSGPTQSAVMDALNSKT